jgi:renal tumor antigen
MKANYDSLARIKKDKEIQALKQLASHDNIVKLHDVLFDEPKCTPIFDSGKLALVFELMDCNLYEYLKSHKKDLKEAKVRDIGYQILKAVDHMHKKGIFHRDIKP